MEFLSRSSLCPCIFFPCLAAESCAAARHFLLFAPIAGRGWLASYPGLHLRLAHALLAYPYQTQERGSTHVLSPIYASRIVSHAWEIVVVPHELLPILFPIELACLVPGTAELDIGDRSLSGVFGWVLFAPPCRPACWELIPCLLHFA